MITFVQAHARSSWRINVTFNDAFGGMTNAATYSIARVDGAGTTITVSRAWTTDVPAVDLALSEALVDGVIYRLTATGVTGWIDVASRRSLAQVLVRDERRDPEAEAFGVDLDWLAQSLTPEGDVPDLRGRVCLQQDLAAIAVTRKGELFHRPEAGAGMRQRVNGPSDLGEIRAAVRAEWMRDDRVRAVDVRAVLSTAGEVTMNATVTPMAVNENVLVEV